MSSPQFAKNLASISELRGATHGNALSGSAALSSLVQSVACVKYVPSNRADETADTGIVQGCQCAGAPGPFARTAFGEHNLERWNAVADGPDLAASRACMVNTIAHEWTHAILDASRKDSMFKDGGHLFSSAPLVSYTVGAVAQCTFLEQQDPPLVAERQFASCVERIGVKSFAGDVCAPKWYEKRMR